VTINIIRNILTVVVLITTFFVHAHDISASDDYTRLAGKSRLDTAIQISQYGWPNGLMNAERAVILARADNPTDALSSASLAGAKDAPILLTFPNYLSPEVLAEIKRLKADKVYLLGGTGAIKEEVETTLINEGLSVVRINGANRFETAVLINEAAGSSMKTRAIIANAFTVADAISASTDAAINEIPIYLSKKDKLPIKLPVNIRSVDIYGGKSVISDEVVKQLEAEGISVNRVSGKSRYETNIAALNKLNKVTIDNMIIVRGTSVNTEKEDYPDAVAASGLANKMNAMVVLTNRNNTPNATKGFINEHYREGQSTFVLGGKVAIANQALRDAGFYVSEYKTIDEIEARWAKFKSTFSGDKYAEQPVVSAPYKVGKLHNNYINESINLTNFVRFLADLPDDLYHDVDMSEEAQHGAVLLHAIDKLTHHPQKPADMSQDFYERGYSATTSSNIAKGYHDISPTVIAYMDDFGLNNVEVVGHRRWILNPSMQKLGFGLSGQYSVMKVFDRSRSRQFNFDYTSWPNQGAFPTQLFTYEEPWSVTLSGDKYSRPELEEVTVNVTRLSDNQSWVLDADDNTVSEGGEYFNVNNAWYGLPNCIIFRPATQNGISEDEKFKVEITGIKHKDGTPATITYTIELFELEGFKY
jgi:putative cell wall-binding protein